MHVERSALLRTARKLMSGDVYVPAAVWDGSVPRAGHRRKDRMIIDCHGHYTTAPKELQAFRDAQIAALDDPGAARRRWTACRSATTQIRESLENAQLKLQRERGTRPDDLLAARVGDGASHRHRADEHAVVARLQRPDRARVLAVSRELRRRLPAAAIARRAARQQHRRARALRRTSWASSAAISIPIRRAASGTARRSPTALVSALREDGGARRAGDGARELRRATRTSTRPARTTSTPTRPRSCSSSRRICSSDFPTLRFIIPHGGGAVPYHWGRYRGLAQDMKRPPLTELLLNNVFFDTCVYHQPGIDLLAKVIPVENILFGSEMVGAVRGIDPETGHYFDDTKRYIDALPLSDADKQKIFSGNAARVYPRLAPKLANRPRPRSRRRLRDDGGVHDGRELPPVPPEPAQAELQAAGGRGRRALPRVRAGRRVPVRARAQVHAVRRAQGKAVRAARLPGLRQERHRAGELPRPRQHGAGRRARGVGRQSQGRRGRALRHQRPTSSKSSTRPACARCGSTS